MSVLQADDIETKDFSMALPMITEKLNFLVNQLCNSAFGDNYLEPDAIHGLAYILRDIGGELERINDALYPAKDPTMSPPPSQGGKGSPS